MADRHPWTGALLPDYMRVVVGPAYTGPRQTIVDMRPGAPTWPWIQRVDVPTVGGIVTSFIDTGAPGGTYQPTAQELPELVTTAPFPGPSGVPRVTETALAGVPWWLWLLFAIGAASALQSRGTREY